MSDPNRPDFPGLTMAEIRTALGHTTAAPDVEQPIKDGQTYRPTPSNRFRDADDRITVRKIYPGEDRDEPTVAYDIQSTDHRGRPSTRSSALRESVFRRCYVLDVPEPSPETPADIVERALALLDSLDTVAYVIVTPDGYGQLDVTATTRRMHPLDAARPFRAAAQRFEEQADDLGSSVPKCPPDCTCHRVSLDVMGTPDQAETAHAIKEAFAPLRAAVNAAREQQRATAKAQVLREVADDVESEINCAPGAYCIQCATRAADARRFRAAATELEAGR